MSAVPVPTTSTLPALTSSLPVPHSSKDWSHLVAAGTVIAGGALMLTGHKRAGLAVAAAGTAIALLEDQEAVTSWWKNLPGFLSDAQSFLEKAEVYVQQAAAQGHRIQSILRR